MELSGEKIIAASPSAVWRAINDPSVLANCIPSCESVERISDTETHARVLLRIGPVRTLFVGKILMSDIRPDEGCTLVFEGSGGNAGFANGRSTVVLTRDGEATKLIYTAAASVGGKLGQVGGRMIDAFAKKMADEFFGNLQTVLAGSALAPMNEFAAVSAASSSAATVDPAAVGAAAVAPTIARPTPIASHNQPLGEGTRVLWFALGAGATAFGFWLAHLLR